MEVLVAVLIMAIGILGMAGLQVVSMQQNRSALMRAQALQIGNDMLDRIRANPAGTYDDVDFDDDPAAGTTSCVSSDCSEDEMADFDIAQWKCGIKSTDDAGVAFPICVTFGITGDLPGGAGAIDETGNVHTVQVRWIDGPDGSTRTISLSTRARY